jgi:hypothetical protein
MPSIKDQSTVELIGQVFTGAGKRDKGNTLRIVGYAESTCISGKALEDIYGHLRVKTAIAKIDAVQAQIGHRTVENLDAMYQNAHDIAETQKNPVAMATNITGIAKIYGIINDGGASTVKDAPPALSELETGMLAQMRKDAKELTKPRLSKEKTA